MIIVIELQAFFFEVVLFGMPMLLFCSLRVYQLLSQHISVVSAKLNKTPEQIRNEVAKVLQAFGSDNTGHVFNLGHGISQFTPPEAVATMVNAVHELSKTVSVSA